MLLVIDVGNTNITLGVFEGEELKGTFRMTTRQNRTSDEYGILMCNMLEYRGIPKDAVKDAIISSVVPDVMHSLASGVIKYFNTYPIHVGPGCKTGIRITSVNPKEIGADRIVDAVAAYELYGGPVLVLDFGTATTYDLITEDGCFAAGITSPGTEISAGFHFGKRDHHQYAGWPCVRLYRTGGVYYQESKGRIRYPEPESGGNRRAGQDHCG